MNKWLGLLLALMCWNGAGLLIFGTSHKPGRPVSKPTGAAGRIVSMAPNLTERQRLSSTGKREKKSRHVLAAEH